MSESNEQANSGRTFFVEQDGETYEIAPLSYQDLTIEEFYNYGGVRSSADTPTNVEDGAQTSKLFLYEDSEGVSLVLIHGYPLDPDSTDDSGGTAFTFSGLEGSWTIQDDPSDWTSSNSSPPENIQWLWYASNTDGGVFRFDSDDFTVTIDPDFGWGITDWEVLSGDADNPDRFGLQMDDAVTISSDPFDGRVSASVTTLQFIPGQDENVSEGGYPLDSGLIQVFEEGWYLPSSHIPGVDEDLPIKPVLDSWLNGDMTDTLPEYLRAADHPEIERGALDKKPGKYLDDIGADPFHEYRFHNGITVSFETTSDGSVDQDSIQIEFSEGGVAPDDPKVSLGELENSYTVLHRHELDGIPWEEWYGENLRRSNRLPRYYTYDTEYELDGVEGVRVTTIAGGYAGFVQDISERVGNNAAAFFNEIMDWPIPDWQAGLAMLFTPVGTQFLIDFLTTVPNTYSFVDFVVLADGRRYVRVWDASAYPSLATYVDGKLQSLEQMPYQPQELLNDDMNKFFAQAIAGVTPYTAPLSLYQLLVEYPEQAEALLSFVIGRYVPFSDYAVSALTHDVPRVTLGFDGPDGSEVADPNEPFGSVLGLLDPLSGEIKPE